MAEGRSLAILRLRATGVALAAATDAFTQGRSVMQAIWNAPDDI